MEKGCLRADEQGSSEQRSSFLETSSNWSFDLIGPSKDISPPLFRVLLSLSQSLKTRRATTSRCGDALSASGSDFLPFGGCSSGKRTRTGGVGFRSGPVGTGFGHRNGVSNVKWHFADCPLAHASAVSRLRGRFLATFRGIANVEGFGWLGTHGRVLRARLRRRCVGDVERLGVS